MMIKLLAALLVSLMFHSALANAQAGGNVFEEIGGVVAVEAEDYVSQEKDDLRRWLVIPNELAGFDGPDPDPSHHASASSSQYLEALPDTRVTHNDPFDNGSFSSRAGRFAVLNYKIFFNTPGRYFVWVRAYSSGTEDNGIHVGLNGVWPSSGERMQWCSGKNKWTWESKQRTAANHCGEERKIYLDIPSVGEHTVSFSLREDGFEFDKFVLSKTYTKPQGSGPATRPLEPVAPSVPTAPEGLALVALNDQTIEVSWLDRSANEDSFVLQRSLDSRVWTTVANTSTNVTSFTDRAVSLDTRYYYRVSARNTTGGSGFSSIVDISIPSVEPVSGAIPGRIEVEDYRDGGAGIGYNDTTIGNRGGEYRQDDVDIQKAEEGGFSVGWIEAGEWLAFNVTVAKTGNYRVTARVASAQTTTKSLHVDVAGENVSGAISFNTNGAGWQAWRDASVNNVFLQAGTYDLRVMLDSSDFNLNYLEFELSSEMPDESEPDPTNDDPGDTEFCLPVKAKNQNTAVLCF